MNDVGQPGIDNPICNSCGLYVGKNTPFHGLEGNPHPKILVIGEAVCCDGDVTGSIFKGASGKMIKELLRSCGYGDCSAFLNIVRCHPEGNKLSTRVIKACSQFLWRDLLIMRSHLELTILLGKTAFDVVIGVKEKQWNDYMWILNTETDNPNAILLCYTCYHPAYIMRRRSLEAQWKIGLKDALDHVPRDITIKGWDYSNWTIE